MAPKAVEVEKGIWIDEHWIRDAELGPRVRVIVRPGEIRIIDEAHRPSPLPSTRGWDVFRTLGNHAPRGRLANAAAEHDRYLYKKKHQ